MDTLYQIFLFLWNGLRKLFEYTIHGVADMNSSTSKKERNVPSRNCRLLSFTWDNKKHLFFRDCLCALLFKLTVTKTKLFNSGSYPTALQKFLSFCMPSDIFQVHLPRDVFFITNLLQNVVILFFWLFV